MNTNLDEVKRELELRGFSVRLEEPMRLHTSFKTGGPAEFFFMVSNKKQLVEAVTILQKKGIPYIVVGNGSNVLIGDKGIRGAVIALCASEDGCTVSAGGEIISFAGVSLSVLANAAAKHGLTGLEFASGIPGTLGGAVCMNAGAYDGEMKDVLLGATVWTKESEILELSNEALNLGYRKSIIPEKEYLVLEAKLKLLPGNPADIRQKMADFNQRRREKQPLQYASAGSTFKRPTGFFAGKLIEDSGLKGFSVGDAQVSEKHAGFIINKGNATSKDILQVIRYVQEKVLENYGVVLEPEIKLLGDF